MLKRAVIEDLVILLRGFFATPMISSLGRLGVLEEMRQAESFSASAFTRVANTKLLEDTFRYFARLGLLERVDGSEGHYRASELGQEVFRRANSFYVPHSYFEYMHRYHDLIQDGKSAVVCQVERLENVIGSGITHLRYFPPAVSYLKRKAAFELLVDIGCGDGQFLTSFLEAVPDKRVIGVDLSSVSTETTLGNLRTRFPQTDVATVCCDALDVQTWSLEVRRLAGNARIAFSMWFLLHEISRNRTDILVDFFRRIAMVFPDAPIVVGEVVRQSEEVLLGNSAASLMPEYLFFHEMSGRGSLPWQGYREVLAQIPYELVQERLFDEASDSSGQKIPSTFVWCLKPEAQVKAAEVKEL